MDHITIDEIIDKLDFFHKMYDAVRLIDPLHKRVIDFRDSSVVRTKQICYQYWGNNKICDNCISTRSYKENKSLVKMESKSDTVILVTAIPIENVGFPAVLELFKNVTDTMFIGEGDYNKGQMLTLYVSKITDAIVKDPLTSLYNRRYIEERLPADVVESSLSHKPLTVCFIDLDNFKAINDTYGHEAGDDAIKKVGNVIIHNVGERKGWTARYGGDEFLICLYNAREEEAVHIMEGIQKEVENISVDLEGQDVRLSLSFGINTMEDVSVTAKDLIRAADKKMYLSKKHKIKYGT
ncbi:GGDEF domain-containing protein [Clostridium sp. HBUAS56010]|uniref:GGDEF domain-containing protein n=1 Tax=Clostridium sp. HBUAS56010 TaxID=2571127 RepID=UPI001177D933|nr:GGDEF domain-containing protein [Clostridium sp. HBUAS56010]